MRNRLVTRLLIVALTWQVQPNGFTCNAIESDAPMSQCSILTTFISKSSRLEMNANCIYFTFIDALFSTQIDKIKSKDERRHLQSDILSSCFWKAHAWHLCFKICLQRCQRKKLSSKIFFGFVLVAYCVIRNVSFQNRMHERNNCKGRMSSSQLELLFERRSLFVTSESTKRKERHYTFHLM